MRPPIWRRIRTNSGWHLSLIAPNGEPLMTSEVYNNKREVDNLLAILSNADMPGEGGFSLQEVDQRIKPKEGEQPKFWRATCRDCSWSTMQQDYTQRANYVGQHRLQTAHRVTMSLDKE